MTKTIDGIPEEITVEQLTEMCALIGIEARDVLELHMRVGIVTATVIARDADGKRIVGGDDGADYGKHNIAIKIAH